MTGDQADNAQRNEFRWTRELIEGGSPLSFNSGVNDPDFAPVREAEPARPSCAQDVAQAGGRPPHRPRRRGRALHRRPGLRRLPGRRRPAAAGLLRPRPAARPVRRLAHVPGPDGPRPQLTFTPAGLDVPSYWSNGNHDVLVQGNEDAIAPLEDIATACFKALGTTLALPPSSPGPDFVPDPNLLLARPRRDARPARPRAPLPRPPADQGGPRSGQRGQRPRLRVRRSGRGRRPRNGNASYYAWDPPQTPGFRFINIDTNSEGGQTAEGVASGSSNGNIDDPQFQWLTGELDAAQAADKLIVLFGHHPVRSMNTEIADEQALPCTRRTTPTATRPSTTSTPAATATRGCRRRSTSGRTRSPAIRARASSSLLDDYPNVIAYVAGHTHEHRLIPFDRARPERLVGDQQLGHRRLAPAAPPGRGDGQPRRHALDLRHRARRRLALPAARRGIGRRRSTPSQLASIGRTIAFNDPGNNQSGEGALQDRNVEMLLDDPREADVSVTKADRLRPRGRRADDRLRHRRHQQRPEDDAHPRDPRGPASRRPPATRAPTPTQGTCTPPVAGTLNCALGDIAPGQTVSVTHGQPADGGHDHQHGDRRQRH